jgi:hypothetical protein
MSTLRYSQVLSGCSQVLCSKPSTPAVLQRTLRTGSARRERRSGRRKGTPPRPPADGATPASPSPGIARPSHARTHARMQALAQRGISEQRRASARRTRRAYSRASTASAAIELAGGSQRGTPNMHQTNRTRPIERTSNQTANSHPPAPPVPRTLPESTQRPTHTDPQPHTRNRTLAHSPSSTRLNCREAFMMMMHPTHGLCSPRVPPLPSGDRMCGRHLARAQRELCRARRSVVGAEVEGDRRGDDEAGGRHQRAERAAAAAITLWEGGRGARVGADGVRQYSCGYGAVGRTAW